MKILQTIQHHQVNIGAETLRGINAPDALQQQLFATLGAKELPLH